MAIPRNLIQTVRSYDELPDELKVNISDLQARNPDWAYVLYEDAEMRDFIRSHVSGDDWSHIGSLNPKYTVILADLFRYLCIYEKGGVYLDIKSTAKEPLSAVITDDTRFVISQWQNRLGEPFVASGFHPELECVPGGEFQQWHIIAEPRHPFLKAAIDRTLHNIRTYTAVSMGVSSLGVFRVSGPICYTQAIWPLIDEPGTKIVDIHDWGFRYSVYQEMGDTYRYAKLSPNHYSQSTEPLFWRSDSFHQGRKSRGNLGDLLAAELRDNLDLVLKLAIFSFVSTGFLVLFLPITLWFLLSD